MQSYCSATCMWSSPASESPESSVFREILVFIILSGQHALQINRSQTNQPIRREVQFCMFFFFFFLLLKPLQMAKKKGVQTVMKIRHSKRLACLSNHLWHYMTVIQNLRGFLHAHHQFHTSLIGMVLSQIDLQTPDIWCCTRHSAISLDIQHLHFTEDHLGAPKCL